MPTRPSRLPDRLLQSWTANAAAVLEAVARGLPPGGRVLDVGRGEGWPCRALEDAGARAHSVDASAPLVEAARQASGSFDVVSYGEAVEEPGRLGGPYDAAVFTFALSSDEVSGVLRAAASRTAPGGRGVVQTVHPLSVSAPYRDGWREEAFVAFGGGFEPMPWYFGTFRSWVRALRTAGLTLVNVGEPEHPETRAPLSLALGATP